MMNAYTGERLLLTLWVGSLWAIGYLAVPMAFANMEVSLAGDYAGKLFHAVNILGIACGVVLIVSRLFIFGFRRFHLYWRSWMLLLMLASCLVFIGYLQPEMQTLKQQDWQQSEQLVAQFTQLHKFSQNLYLAMSLFGLMLVLTTDKPTEAANTLS